MEVFVTHFDHKFQQNNTTSAHKIQITISQQISREFVMYRSVICVVRCSSSKCSRKYSTKRKGTYTHTRVRVRVRVYGCRKTRNPVISMAGVHTDTSASTGTSHPEIYW